MTSQRILDFLATERPDGPCLVVDLDIVRRNFLRLAEAFPATGIYYAVKANPAPEILDLLASLGCSFDTASVSEIEMALAAGATPDRISYGNTIKKERDIARALALAKAAEEKRAKEAADTVASATAAAATQSKTSAKGAPAATALPTGSLTAPAASSGIGLAPSQLGGPKEVRAPAEAAPSPEVPKVVPQPISKSGLFLREVHASACRIFATTLGPEANEAHRNHFHFDMAPRRRSAFCE